jgi:ubiquinone/menaquinone biosynthesis C-methylase UbiE
MNGVLRFQVPVTPAPGRLSDWVDILCTPITHQPLQVESGRLSSKDGVEGFEISPSGIPLFAQTFVSDAASLQQKHYDKIVSKYVENLGYPHTEEYMRYLDREFELALPVGTLGTVAELCCGRGEAAHLLGHRMDRCLGLDVSSGMLEIARRDFPDARYFFVQGDATALPISDRSVDNVVMLGGIHHVPDRARLFAEVKRILKPNGNFYFREPVDDFPIWRGIRKIIYRISDTLDHKNERPLRREETESSLRSAGLTLTEWRTIGFLGFCLFMNSDVLVFNRLFRFLPGIRVITRAACAFDNWMTTRRPFRNAGLQVIGVATPAKNPLRDPP